MGTIDGTLSTITGPGWEVKEVENTGKTITNIRTSMSATGGDYIIMGGVDGYVCILENEKLVLK